MPDYASILRRSIAALPNPGPDMREAVYQRARAALARQLTAVDPPLSTREIERQHQELEDAVTRLEADYAAEAEAPAVEESFEEDYFEPASEPHAGELHAADPDTIREQRHAQARDEDERGEDDDEGDEFEEEEDGRGSRAPLLIGLLLVMLVVVGAGAYAYAERDTILSYLGLSDAEDRVATIEPPSEPDTVRVVAPEGEADAAAEPPGGTAPAAAAPEKQSDRLTNGDEALPPPEPPPSEAAGLAEPAEPVEPVEPVEPTEPVEPAEPAVPPAADAAPAEPTAPPEDAAAPDEEQTAALQDPAQSIVAQRAIYYFQGAEGQPGRATEGTVTWAQVSKEGNPAIQATLRLEEQDLTATVTIHKNEDQTLPASHLVEVLFSGAIGDSPIQRVPAIVVKETEQARGEPLAGAAVPVTNEMFWIALSDEPEQVARNERLLRQGSWFDVPILFQDGTRALLVFEKGIPGDRVFETVMAGWPD